MNVAFTPSRLQRERMRAAVDRRVRSVTNYAHLERLERDLEDFWRRKPAHASKSRCVNGHRWTVENTYWYPDGRKRMCRACKREWHRRHMLMREAA